MVVCKVFRLNQSRKNVVGEYPRMTRSVVLLHDRLHAAREKTGFQPNLSFIPRTALANTKVMALETIIGQETMKMP